MKLCYLVSDFDAPGAYRGLFPGRQLKERGHTVTMPPYTEHAAPDGRLGIEFKIDLHPPNPMADIWVLQQRKERMWPQGGIMALRNHGIVTVAECDDNYLEVPAYNPAFVGTHPYRTSGGRIRNRAERRALQKSTGIKLSRESNSHNRDHLHKGFEMVDAVTVSTPYLKEVYSRFNPNIQVIRNYLDWEMWADVTPQYELERERIRVGYMGVFGFRRGDLDVIRPVIRPFLLKHSNVDFVASSEEVQDYLDIPKDRRITTGEVDFRSMRLPEITAVMDVGLVPLTMNGLNEGKSHLKGLEYNACGIPFIASPTESYRDYWCEEGRNGFTVSDSKDWHERLEVLVEDNAQRRQMGSYGRTKASEHTIQKNAGEWESFYLGLLGGDEETLARQTLLRGSIQKTGELAGLLKILKGRRLKTVVEIGSARGGTFWCWAQVADDDALLVSIDLPGADFSAPELVNKTPEQVQKYSELVERKMMSYAREGQRALLIRGDSHSENSVGELLKVLNGREIDFLFIDGDHSYQGCRSDYELYSPFVADGGVIAFHDIIGRPQQKECRVPEVWSELRAQNRCVELYDSNTWGYGRWAGIGVLYKERTCVAA